MRICDLFILNAKDMMSFELSNCVQKNEEKQSSSAQFENENDNRPLQLIRTDHNLSFKCCRI